MTASKTHYLQAPQIAIIFLSFALLTVPLAWLQLTTAVPPDISRWITLGYVVIFGNTHFAITWALYLNAENLRYFSSSAGRKAVYFLGPPAILVTFWYLGVRQLPSTSTLGFLVFTVLITSVDYFHSVRQAFGVYELFRARTGVAFPSWMPSVDNGYFLALWALQTATVARSIFTGVPGHFDPADPLVRVGLAVAAVLLFFILRNLYAAWQQTGDRAAVVAALVYLALQSASALMVVYRSRLYVASLAMHYVEYHVLMAPRLFQVPLNPAAPADRIAGFFRRYRMAFYMALLLIAGWASAASIFAYSGMPIAPTGPRSWWYLVNMFNGIFLAHYFIEAFVWKFGNPFYRETLRPLYFAARLEPAMAGAAGAASAGRTPRSARSRP